MTRVFILKTLMVLCVFLISRINASKFGDTFNSLPKDWGAIDHRWDNNGHQAFVACNKYYEDNAREYDCIIVSETKYSHEKRDYICKVTLQAKQLNGFIHREKRIFMFGENKTILFFKEVGPTDYFRIKSILPDDCKMTDVEITDHSDKSVSDYASFRGYNNSFELFFKNPICGDKMCWVVMDNNGTVIKGPIGYYDPKGRNAPFSSDRIDVNVAEKGHVFIEITSNTTDYYLRKPDGMEKLLAHSEFRYPLAVSRANNLMGLCFWTKDAFKCSQYDLDGNLKLEVRVDKNFKNMDRPREVHNVPNGGFYILYNNPKPCFTRRRRCPAHFVIKKIDAESKQLGCFLVDPLPCTIQHFSAFHFFDNTEGRQCVVKTCTQEDEIREPGITCFDDAVFSNKLCTDLFPQDYVDPFQIN